MSLHKDIYSDNDLEELWRQLTDIPVDESDCIELSFHIFETGTSKFDIWHWFDHRYSKGVHYLMYPNEHPEFVRSNEKQSFFWHCFNCETLNKALVGHTGELICKHCGREAWQGLRIDE